MFRFDVVNVQIATAIGAGLAAFAILVASAPTIIGAASAATPTAECGAATCAR